MALKLIIEQGDADPRPEERLFDDGILTIGSDPASTLCLTGGRVAAEQALVINDDGQLIFINRADGTLLNGEPLAREARRPLSDGDSLAVGPYRIRFVLNDAGGAAPRDRADAPARGDGLALTPAPARDLTPAHGAAEPANKSFASILDSLRTEEDRFYFQVETAAQGRWRVAIESAEMLVGWDETGLGVVCDAGRVVEPRAVVRKDWSGVVVQPQGADAVFVNGEALDAPRRLRNGDRLTMLPTNAAAAPDEAQHYLIFHEPASLVVLDSLLPQQLPPPVAQPQALAAAAAPEGEAAALAPAQAAPLAKRRHGLFDPGRRYFGYFTFTEVLVMAFGTLATAVVIFLVLEFS